MEILPDSQAYALYVYLNSSFMELSVNYIIPIFGLEALPNSWKLSLESIKWDSYRSNEFHSSIPLLIP